MVESVQMNTSPTEYGARGDAADALKREGVPDRPETDEKETLHKVWSGFEEAKQYKYSQVNPRDWKRWAMIYGDQHWDGTQKEWQSTPTINLTFAAINSLLPIITDNRPQIAVIPRKPSEARIADVLRAVIEWLWEENNCDVKLPKTMLNACIFGNGFWKILWNPAARRGVGDIQIVNIDPTLLFFNPEATDIEDAEAIYHVEQMSLVRIAQLWPDKAHLIAAKVKDPELIIDRPQHSQKAGGRQRTIDVQTTTGSDVWMYPHNSANRDARPRKDSATICERWLLDKESRQWRRTVVSNEVVIEDEMTDFEQPPFVHFVDYPVPWTIWASGEVQHVENLQYELNKRRGMILDILRFCASPVLVYDPGAGVDLENLEVIPGMSIPVEGGPQAAHWMIPQMDLGGLFQVNDRDKLDFNDILGNVDIIQGKRPVGIEAGVALEQLSEAANTRLRLKVRLMEASLRRCGKLLIRFIQKHYTSMRIFRIVGNEFSADGSVLPASQSSFMAINRPVGAMPGQPQESPEGEPIIGEDGIPAMEAVYDDTSNHIPEDAEFDVKVGAGSTLPVSRTVRFQQAITLFDRGALDIGELLKAAAWPRYEEVAQRMEQKQAMAIGPMGQPGMGGPGGRGPGGAPLPTPEEEAQIPQHVDELDQG